MVYVKRAVGLLVIASLTVLVGLVAGYAAWKGAR